MASKVAANTKSFFQNAKTTSDQKEGKRIQMGQKERKRQLEQKPVQYLPGRIQMIAACKPSEKTIDIGNVKKRAGLRRWERDEKVVYDNKNGGALTSALLKVLYNHYHAIGDYNYQQDHTKIPKFLQGDSYLDDR